MKKITTVFVVLIITGCVFAAQNSNTKAPAKPKPAPVDCTKVDDAGITANVKDKLAKTPSLKEATINVETKDGVVTLTGTVKLGRNKGLATLQTKRVACVKKVMNQITSEQSMAKEKKPKASQ